MRQISKKEKTIMRKALIDNKSGKVQWIGGCGDHVCKKDTTSINIMETDITNKTTEY